jgi:hypothetical protein
MDDNEFNLNDFVSEVPVVKKQEAPEDYNNNTFTSEVVEVVKEVLVLGPKGEDGRDGVDGAKGADGIGLDGADGLDGLDGVSVVDTFVDGDDLFTRLSDGKLINAGNVRGKQGLQGPQGSGGGKSYRGGGNKNVPEQIVYVKKASQLTGTLDSNKLYFLDGEINMGLESIIVPPTGLSIAGHGFGISGLVSTEDNHTLFVTNGVTYSGDLYLTSIDIRCTGIGSKVFDIDNQENSNATEWNTVNFLSCTSLGEIKNYRQGLCRNIAWISCKDGLTMTGAWSGGWAAVDSIIVGAPLTGVLFRAGAGLLISGSFRTDMNILQLGTAGGIFCDFSPANIALDGGFSVDNLRANPDANNFPNMPNTSVKARYRSCAGVRNTYVGASGTITTSVVTTVTTSGVYYSMAGSLSVDEPTWLILFEDAGIEFNSEIPTAFDLAGAFSFAGPNNQVLSLKLYKYTADTMVWSPASPAFEVTMNAADRAENVSFGTFVDMVKGDRLEFRVANLTGTGDITALLGGQVRLKER